jgi:hypothetical protein
LGRWLHGEGREVLGAHPHFDDLVTEHAVFHREAAALVRAIDAGEARSAMRQLEDAQSHFNQASSKVVSLLMALKSDVA